MSGNPIYYKLSESERAELGRGRGGDDESSVNEWQWKSTHAVPAYFGIGRCWEIELIMLSKPNSSVPLAAPLADWATAMMGGGESDQSKRVAVGIPCKSFVEFTAQDEPWIRLLIKKSLSFLISERASSFPFSQNLFGRLHPELATKVTIKKTYAHNFYIIFFVRQLIRA